MNIDTHTYVGLNKVMHIKAKDNTKKRKKYHPLFPLWSLTYGGMTQRGMAITLIVN